MLSAHVIDGVLPFGWDKEGIALEAKLFRPGLKKRRAKQGGVRGAGAVQFPEIQGILHGGDAKPAANRKKLLISEGALFSSKTMYLRRTWLASAAVAI